MTHWLQSGNSVASSSGYLTMKIEYRALSMLVAIMMMIASYAQASVVMTGTRIIYPAGANEKIIQFSNPDPQPYVMQLQLTKENNQPDLQAPFVLLPPVFRMEPHSGQSVRLIANGTDRLPQNKESLFYLNFTQLPSMKSSLQGKNSLVIALTSRVKIFYRPDTLVGNSIDAYKDLVFSAHQGGLTVTNPTGFYINISAAQILMSGKVIGLPDAGMLAPQSTSQWRTGQKITSLNGASIKLTMVNDYGTDIIQERPIENR